MRNALPVFLIAGLLLAAGARAQQKPATPLPPDVDCEYGTTLAAARAKKEQAELAARVLHR